jgi:hypothetical protein
MRVFIAAPMFGFWGQKLMTERVRGWLETDKALVARQAMRRGHNSRSTDEMESYDTEKFPGG